MVKYCFKIVCSDFLSIVFQFLVLVNQSKHDCEPLSALALDYIKKSLSLKARFFRGKFYCKLYYKQIINKLYYKQMPNYDKTAKNLIIQ